MIPPCWTVEAYFTPSDDPPFPGPDTVPPADQQELSAFIENRTPAFEKS